jgi:hypothetical protein
LLSALPCASLCSFCAIFGGRSAWEKRGNFVSLSEWKVVSSPCMTDGKVSFDVTTANMWNFTCPGSRHALPLRHCFCWKEGRNFDFKFENAWRDGGCSKRQDENTRQKALFYK